MFTGKVWISAQTIPNAFQRFTGGKKKELHSLNSIVAKFVGEKITDSEYLLYIPLEELPLSRHYGVLD